MSVPSGAAASRPGLEAGFPGRVPGEGPFPGSRGHADPRAIPPGAARRRAGRRPPGGPGRRRDGFGGGLVLSLLVLLLLALPVAAARAGSPEAAAPEPRGATRVVGGTAARDGEWPSQVVILAPDPVGRGLMRRHCGGTVVGARYVLTAAHCFVASAGPGARRQTLAAPDILVLVGRNSVPARLERTAALAAGARAAAAVTPHPAFDPAVFANDVALIELAGPADAPAMPLIDPELAGNDLSGLKASVIGFGRTREGSDETDLPLALQEATLPVVALERCRAAFADSPLAGNRLDDGNLCAGFAGGGVDACQGDSGGPLVARAENGDFVQIGLVSWGEGCGRAGRFGVYTRLAAHIGWLQAVSRNALAPPARPAPDNRLSPDLPVAGATSDLPVAAADATVFSLMTPTSIARAGETMRPGDRALVIGIDGYPDPFAVSGVRADVRDAVAALTGDFGFRFDQVLVLTNEQATRDNIRAAFDTWLTQGSRAGDRVVLYYTGQGIASRVLPSLRRGGSGPVIVPFDAQMRRDEAGRLADVERVLAPADIQALLRRLDGRSVTAIFDAASAGSGEAVAAIALAGIGADVRAVDARVPVTEGLAGRMAAVRAGAEEVPPPGMVVWLAGRPGEPVASEGSGDEARGFASRLVWSGLAGERLAGADGDRSVAAFSARLAERMDARCRMLSTQCRFEQTPELLADAATGAGPLAGQLRLRTEEAAGGVGQELSLTRTARGAVVARATRSGALIVVAIAADGQMQQVYPAVRPNGTLPDNRMAAGQVVEVIPADAVLGSRAVPFGTRLFVGLLADRPVQRIDLPDQPAEAVDPDGSLAFLQRWVADLRVPDARSGALSAVAWSFSTPVSQVTAMQGQ